MQTTPEVVRVSEHIANAARLAASHDVSQLSHVQRLIRTLLLDEIERYRAEGRFPKNPDFAERTPYFIDASGTRCAMAHLMELGGEHELVDRIATTRNNAYVRELADEPELLAWLEAAGLSVAEAAAIQPSYSCQAKSECVCGGGFSFPGYPLPAKGVLEVVAGQNGKTALVDKTYGDTLGIAKGSTIQLSNTAQSGTRLLVAIDESTLGDGGPVEHYGVPLQSDGLYHCTSQGVTNAPTLTPANFSAAVTAADCKQTLVSVDPEWGKGCGSGGGLEPRGCSAAGSEASVGILLALVSAIVYRRLRAQ